MDCAATSSNKCSECSLCTFSILRMNFKEQVMSCNVGSSSEGMVNATFESSLYGNYEKSRSCIDLQSENETVSIARERTGKGMKGNGMAY